LTNQGYITSDTISKNGTKHFFVSEGSKSIVKVISYDQVGILNDKKVFNLGFGDYDIISGVLDDASTSDNGDVYKVFNTILSTIPKFFESFRKDIIMVEGSDSTTDFTENCILTCRKKCLSANQCKNQNRRINVYRNYVNKNFEDLKLTYTFYGGLKNEHTIEMYLPGKKYDSVFVIKNN